MYEAQSFLLVIPAKAGIQASDTKLDPRLRGDDSLRFFNSCVLSAHYALDSVKSAEFHL